MFQDASEGFQVMGTAKIVSMALRNSLLWAVPFFVMVSGALLLDPEKEMSYKKIYSKYILRIFVCLVAACLIYGIIEIAIWGKDSPLNDFKVWFLAFYMGLAGNHYGICICLLRYILCCQSIALYPNI